MKAHLLLGKYPLTFYIILFSIVSSETFAQYQTQAKACGSGCYVVTASARKDGACGGSNDYTYTITNNSSRDLDIRMFVEKSNGEWKDLGILTDVESGEKRKDAFWSCNLTGRYYIYYRNADSNDRFPSESEVNKRARNGY